MKRDKGESYVPDITPSLFGPDSPSLSIDEPKKIKKEGTTLPTPEAPTEPGHEYNFVPEDESPYDQLGSHAKPK